MNDHATPDGGATRSRSDAMATLMREAEAYARLLVRRGYADDPRSYDAALVRALVAAGGLADLEPMASELYGGKVRRRRSAAVGIERREITRELADIDQLLQAAAEGGVSGLVALAIARQKVAELAGVGGATPGHSAGDLTLADALHLANHTALPPDVARDALQTLSRALADAKGLSLPELEAYARGERRPGWH